MDMSIQKSVPSLRGHLQIMRADHWIKNVFVLPGIVVASAFRPEGLSGNSLFAVLIGMIAVCLVASSNYVINELLDAEFDLKHKVKCRRPVPSGLVNVPLAYVQWLVLMAAGVGLGLCVAVPFASVLLVLWIMGCIYNIPPFRAKDLPYIDVLTEAVNNPLRMLAGWYLVGPKTMLPISLLFSYWMVGAYFMAVKRFAEFRHIGDAVSAASYRKSFAFYTQQNLLVSIMFYASASMLFLGTFVVRYRLEMILSYPLVALVMAIYLDLAFKDNSAVQAPERLYREPRLMLAVITCAMVMTILLFVDIPILHRFFAPTLPTNPIFRGPFHD